MLNGPTIVLVLKNWAFCFRTALLILQESIWGEKVFESTTQENGWKGDDYNSGVYLYTATGTYTDGAPLEIKGNVTLVR